MIVGAIIEARSCERFHALVPALEGVDADLAKFYSSLLRAESRHFRDYIDLAELAAGGPVEWRCTQLLAVDARLVRTPDKVLRFHSPEDIMKTTFNCKARPRKADQNRRNLCAVRVSPKSN